MRSTRLFSLSNSWVWAIVTRSLLSSTRVSHSPFQLTNRTRHHSSLWQCSVKWAKHTQYFIDDYLLRPPWLTALVWIPTLLWAVRHGTQTNAWTWVLLVPSPHTLHFRIRLGGSSHSPHSTRSSPPHAFFSRHAHSITPTPHSRTVCAESIMQQTSP